MEKGLNQSNPVQQMANTYSCTYTHVHAPFLLRPPLESKIRRFYRGGAAGVEADKIQRESERSTVSLAIDLVYALSRGMDAPLCSPRNPSSCPTLFAVVFY